MDTLRVWSHVCAQVSCIAIVAVVGSCKVGIHLCTYVNVVIQVVVSLPVSSWHPTIPMPRTDTVLACRAWSSSVVACLSPSVPTIGHGRFPLPWFIRFTTQVPTHQFVTNSFFIGLPRRPLLEAPPSRSSYPMESRLHVLPFGRARRALSRRPTRPHPNHTLGSPYQHQPHLKPSGHASEPPSPPTEGCCHPSSIVVFLLFIPILMADLLPHRLLLFLAGLEFYIPAFEAHSLMC